MSVAQGSHASAVYYVPTAAGHEPMYAYPVQYPDGRIMYHILSGQVSRLCNIISSGGVIASLKADAAVCLDEVADNQLF